MSTASSPNGSSTDSQGGSGARRDSAGAAASGRDWLAKLRGSPMVALILVGSAALAILVALLLWARAPEYRVLYSTLTDADGGRIISQLDAMEVPYRFSDGGQALMVPGDQVRSLRLRLAEQGLPQAGGVGFELMDDQAFGISQFAEQVNYQRALEGELSRTIATLGNVENARVHLAMAKESVFVRENQPASASVVLDLQPGRVLSAGQIAAIGHMVSSSVAQLSTADVTIIDQNGDLLTRADSDANSLDGSQLDYVRNLERVYADRIESILGPIVGGANVKAQVTAQVDFAQREQTAERYTPNQSMDNAAIRSRQSSTSFQGSGDLAMGIPGALSNQPPGTAPSPINADDTQADEGNDGDAAGTQDAAQNDTAATAQSNGGGDSGRSSQQSTVNYEVDRTVEHIQQRSGAIQRLSVAVVVNYRDSIDEDGNPVEVALDDTEMTQIRGLARQAMGFSQARGDALEVVNSPFQVSRQTFEPEPWWQTPAIWSLATQVLKYLAVALVALFLWYKVVKPLLRQQVQHSSPSPALASANGANAASAAASYQQFDETSVDNAQTSPSQRQRQRARASSYDQDLSDAREMAQEDPRLIAMVVRSWMDKA